MRDQPDSQACQVAILLSTHNGERHLGEQLDSLLAQRPASFTIRVRDDASTDGTRSLLAAYAARHACLEVSSGERQGAVGSYFSLLREAPDVDFYALCDQDDVWLADKLAVAVQQLADVPADEPALYMSGVEFVTTELAHVGFSPVSRHIGFTNALAQNAGAGCTFVFNHAARRRFLAAPPSDVIWHDWWMYLLVSAFGRVIYDPTPRIRYRQHGGNLVGGTPHLTTKLWKRLRRFRLLGRDAFRISDQAREFRRCFGEGLAPDKRVTLDRLLASKRSLPARLRYALTTDLQRQTAMDTLILRVLIALGLY